MLVGKAVTMEFYNFNVYEFLKVRVRRLLNAATKLVNKPTAEVSKNNKQFNLNHVKELTGNGFTKVRPSERKTVVDPEQAKVEDTFWEQD